MEACVMTVLAATVAATLFLSEPLPPNCGQFRPDIAHEYGGPWTVACGDPADPGMCIGDTRDDALRAWDWTCGRQGQ